MNVKLTIKLFLYRISCTKFGKFILKLLSFGISIDNLTKSYLRKYPFLVIITVDTESGYVTNNQRRAWQKEKPDAFQGYYYGVRNLLKVFDKHKIKTTLFLSTNCFSSNGNRYFKIKNELNNIVKKRHEIGLHLHPDSDLSIQKKLSKKFNATSAFFYEYKEKLDLIRTAKKLIEEHLGKRVAKKLASFRWGNWALDTNGAKALQALGFHVDSSATPGIKGHTNDKMKYDWSKTTEHYPWKLSILNYQATNHNNSDILEIPIATFKFFWIKMRADPVNSILLNKAFIKYYYNADRSKKPFPFVVITHSSEATTIEGKPTQTLRDLDTFISYAKKYRDVKFTTLIDAFKLLKI